MHREKKLETKLVFVSPSRYTQKCTSTSLTLQTVTRTAGRNANREGMRQKAAPSPAAPLPTCEPLHGDSQGVKESGCLLGAISAERMRQATQSASKSPKCLELRKGLLHLSTTCDVPFTAFPPVISTQSSILGSVNRWLTGRAWKKLEAGAGRVHSIYVLCFPRPPPALPLIHNGYRSHAWRFLLEEVERVSWWWEPHLFSGKMNLAWEIRLRTEAGKTSDRVLASRDNMSFVELQTAGMPASHQKDSPVLSGLRSGASSFHPVITLVLTKVQS